MKIKVDTVEAVPADEASATGRLKGLKDFSDATNRGYLFEALDDAHDLLETALQEVEQGDEYLAECQGQLDKLDKLRDELNKVGAAALRDSLNRLYSPQHAADAGRDKLMKDAVKVLYDVFGDLDKGKDMVLTLTSSRAVNAKRTLLQGKTAVQVTMDTLKDSGLLDDATEPITVTRVASRRANASMAKELAPLIEQAKGVVASVDDITNATVPASEYKKLLDKLTEMYESASQVTKVISTTVDFQAKDVIQKIQTSSEGKADEGFLDKVIDVFKKIASGLGAAFASLKQQFTSLFSKAEEEEDAYAKASKDLTLLGFAPEGAEAPAEANKDEAKGFASLAKQLERALEALEQHPDYCNFADEAYFVQSNIQSVREAYSKLKESIMALQGLVSPMKNEDNMEIVGILADAIAKIADDEEAGSAEEPEEPSVADQVSQEYSNEPDAGAEEPDEI